MVRIKDIVVRPENPFDIKCDVCGGTSTEFARVTKKIELDEVGERMSFKPIGYVKRIVYRYVTNLLREPITSETNICQGCISRTFRGFNKGL